MTCRYCHKVDVANITAERRETYVLPRAFEGGALTLHGIQVLSCPGCHKEDAVIPALGRLVMMARSGGQREFWWSGKDWSASPPPEVGKGEE